MRAWVLRGGAWRWSGARKNSARAGQRRDLLTRVLENCYQIRENLAHGGASGRTSPALAFAPHMAPLDRCLSGGEDPGAQTPHIHLPLLLLLLLLRRASR